MKKQVFAVLLLVVLLLPMFGGIRRIKNLRRNSPPEDKDSPPADS